MIKYSISEYKGKQDNEKLKDNQNYIVFKETIDGLASKGVFKGTYEECLKFKKEKIKELKKVSEDYEIGV